MNARLAAASAAVLLLGFGSLPARAQDNTSGIVIEGITFPTSGHEAVIAFTWKARPYEARVYDTASDMRASPNWQNATDFHDDTWVFASRENAKAKIIVAFSSENGTHVARVYEDQDGDQDVSYTWNVSAGFHVTETQFPSAIVTSKADWSDHPDAFSILGDSNAPLHSGDRIHLGLGNYARTTDGSLDWRYVVRDSDGDGIPDQQIMETFPLRSPDDQIQRVLIVLNPRNHPYPIRDFLFWPMLGTGGMTLETSDAERIGPIGVDLQAGRIVGLAELIPSRQNEGNVFIYSLKNLPVGRGTSPANFENPFAFYDLDGIDNGTPELSLRYEYYPANDAQFVRPTYPRAIEKVRYSWDQDGDGRWDYKLAMVGHHALSDVVDIGDAQVLTLNYSSAPARTLGWDWDAGCAFVHAPRGYAGSEGIYEWDPEDGWFRGLATARATHTDQFASIERGLRGEYRLAPCDRVQLYASPIDSTLHLDGATGGLAHLDDGTLITSTFDDGGIVGWAAREVDGTNSTLRFAPGHLVAFSKNRTLEVKPTVLPERLWNTSPPQDKASWTSVGAQISTLGKAPMMPQAMFDRLPGTSARILGASAWSVTREGVQFTMGGLGGTLEGNATTTDGALAPGDYELRVEAGTLHLVHDVSVVTPTTPQVRPVPTLGALGVFACVGVLVILWRRARE